MGIISKIKDLFKASSESGLHLPFVYDPTEKGPSITLLFPYVTFAVAIIGNIALFFKPDLLNAAIFSVMFWVIAMVFYRLRKLDKLKIDLDDKSIELEGSDDKEETKEETKKDPEVSEDQPK